MFHGGGTERHLGLSRLAHAHSLHILTEDTIKNVKISHNSPPDSWPVCFTEGGKVTFGGLAYSWRRQCPCAVKTLCGKVLGQVCSDEATMQHASARRCQWTIASRRLVLDVCCERWTVAPIVAIETYLSTTTGRQWSAQVHMHSKFPHEHIQ